MYIYKYIYNYISLYLNIYIYDKTHGILYIISANKNTSAKTIRADLVKGESLERSPFNTYNITI